MDGKVEKERGTDSVAQKLFESGDFKPRGLEGSSGGRGPGGSEGGGGTMVLTGGWAAVCRCMAVQRGSD